jgi:hypothetical protein
LSLLSAAKALLIRMWSILLFPINWRAGHRGLLFAAVVAACGSFLYAAIISGEHRRRIAGIMFAATALAIVPALHLALIDDTGLGSRILYLPSVGFCVAWGHILGSARSQRHKIALCTLIACFGIGLAHNLRAWHEAALLADEVCTVAANAKSVDTGRKPATVRGVFLFKNGFSECVTMKRTERQTLHDK